MSEIRGKCFGFIHLCDVACCKCRSSGIQSNQLKSTWLWERDIVFDWFTADLQRVNSLLVLTWGWIKHGSFRQCTFGDGHPASWESLLSKQCSRCCSVKQSSWEDGVNQQINHDLIKDQCKYMGWMVYPHSYIPSCVNNNTLLHSFHLAPLYTSESVKISISSPTGWVFTALK